jgi:hypothetical protein
MKNNYKIINNVCYVIITQKNGNKYNILIDVEDIGLFNKYKIGLVYKGNYRKYAKIRVKQKCIYLHRFILNPPSNMVIDHLNGNGLDNRKSNLRITNNAGNSIRRDKELMSNNKSGYRGVHWHKYSKKWIAAIQINKKVKYLGYFNDPQKASNMFQEELKKHPDYFEQ